DPVAGGCSRSPPPGSRSRLAMVEDPGRRRSPPSGKNRRRDLGRGARGAGSTPGGAPMSARPSASSARLTAEVLRGPALADLGLRVVAGQPGFHRPISWGRIQRPGLALAGFLPFIKPGRIQIVGESELHYFATMPPELRRERVAAICAMPVAAFVVTKGQRVPDELARECERHNVPLLVSDQTTYVLFHAITRVSDD